VKARAFYFSVRKCSEVSSGEAVDRFCNYFIPFYTMFKESASTPSGNFREKRKKEKGKKKKEKKAIRPCRR